MTWRRCRAACRRCTATSPRSNARAPWPQVGARRVRAETATRYRHECRQREAPHSRGFFMDPVVLELVTTVRISREFDQSVIRMAQSVRLEERLVDGSASTECSVQGRNPPVLERSSCSLSEAFESLHSASFRLVRCLHSTRVSRASHGGSRRFDQQFTQLQCVRYPARQRTSRVRTKPAGSVSCVASSRSTSRSRWPIISVIAWPMRSAGSRANRPRTTP